jgi:Na+/H+-dicarboxylate symporter/ABC-type amino acid transport substrate-binding protein
MAVRTSGNRGSITRKILLSLSAGLFTGLFLGEYAAPMQLLGQAYIGLLQMTVIPYILFSLIANIGRLTHTQARLLARTGLVALVGLWILAGLVVLAMSAALPLISSGSFFSTSLLEAPPRLDLLSLFIPTNVFQSLSNNSVPAVVLFCLLFGTALIGFDNKKTLLEQLDLITAVLQKVNSLVLKLTPIGIFTITASAAGTLSLADFGRLQAYMLTMTVAVILVAVFIYPLLISTCTPLSWRRVVAASRDALITAFVLGSIFAVIPMLIKSVEDMLEDLGEVEGKDSSEHLPQLMLPLAYPFPDAGKILTLLFIPFAAWFYGSPLSAEDLGLLMTLGPVVLFGKVVTAVPFLLDFMQIPADIFQLFLASGVLMSRLADAAGAMHLMAFTFLTTVYIRGQFELRWKRLLPRLAGLLVLVGVLVALINTALYASYKDNYSKGEVVLAMQTMERDVETVVLTEAAPNPTPLLDGLSYGDRINQQKLLRVGFNPDNLPFTYFNAEGQLVGFDIDLVQHLAADLGVTLEFVPYEIENLVADMNNDHFDIAISGITATAQRSAELLFSEPYMFVNMALVIPDYRRREFSSEGSIRAATGLRLGVHSGSNFGSRALEHFPNAKIVPLQSERDFFLLKEGELDALITTAEGGSAWTLLYPEYTTINPVETSERAPLVIAIPHEMDIEEFLEMWVTLRKLDGTIDQLFDYWILGQDPGTEQPRWSIIRDVLHWVD